MEINNNNNGRTMVTIKDTSALEQETFSIMLNEKEIRFLQWLESRELLGVDVEYFILKNCDEDFT